jgi:hypothetical protein
MRPARSPRVLPPPTPDASGVGLIAVLAALIAISVAFVATDGRILDLAASVSAGSGGGILGAQATGLPSHGVPTPVATALAPGATPSAPSATATPLPSGTPSPTPPPAREPTAINLLAGSNPDAIFASEATDKLCAAAAVQMAVELVSGRTDRSSRTQQRIHDLEVALTTRTDSHNGGAGPIGMAATITRLTGVRYELRIARTRWAALRDAARAIERTDRPVVLMAWRGAHAWVMTGFRAAADPILFADARIGGAYILDPWFPRVSSIWGPSDPPNTYQDRAEMIRNYLPWKRPDGHYPGRDGRFLYLAPAVASGG